MKNTFWKIHFEKYILRYIFWKIPPLQIQATSEPGDKRFKTKTWFQPNRYVIVINIPLQQIYFQFWFQLQPGSEPRKKTVASLNSWINISVSGPDFSCHGVWSLISKDSWATVQMPKKLNWAEYIWQMGLKSVYDSAFSVKKTYQTNVAPWRLSVYGLDGMGWVEVQSNLERC